MNIPHAAQVGVRNSFLALDNWPTNLPKQRTKRSNGPLAGASEQKRYKLRNQNVKRIVK